MSPFDNHDDTTRNYLPYDGTVQYYGKIWSIEAADHFLQILLHQADWRNDEVMLFGKRIITKRKVAWYGDHAYAYTYSNTTKNALPWIPELYQLKAYTEKITRESFNACLLNLYHDGHEAMGWHSDAEKDLKKDGAIASISFGAERRFLFRHKQTQEKVPILLEHGSLLIMRGTTQSNWLHRLPPSAQISTPRVNLTFRTIQT